MPLHREAELNGVTLGLGGLVGVTMRTVLVPVPAPLAPPEPLEWNPPVPAGAVVTVYAELVATFAVLVVTTVELELGTKLGRDEPGLGSKVGCGSGGLATPLEMMLATSSPTPWR